MVWHAPENTGSSISSYNVQYKKTTVAAFTDYTASVDGTTVLTATISSLDPDTSYHVRVRAVNDEGTGPWSLVGTGSTNKAGNKPPAFPSEAATRDEFENAPAGQDVGTPVTASDDDATTLTYGLEGPRRRPVRLRHVVRADTDEVSPEPRGPGVRLRRPG